MKLAILAEKPSILTNYIRAATDAYGRPEHVVAAWIDPYTNLWPNFSFTRGRRLADYPLAQEPTYKPFDFDSAQSPNRDRWFHCNPNADGSYGQSLTDTLSDLRAGNTDNRDRLLTKLIGDSSTEQDITRHFRDADEILVLSDRGSVHALCEQMTLAAIVPDGHRDRRVTSTLPHATTSNQDQHLGQLSDQIERRETHERVRGAEAIKGRIALRFDYNYTMNAHSILKPIQVEAGMAPSAKLLSKTALQTLYVLAHQSAPFTDGDICTIMDRHTGTGRYPKVLTGHGQIQLGTPTSRYQIAQNLTNSGLLTDTGRIHERTTKYGDQETPLYVVSDIGLRLIDLLHPDCQDPDLPFRIRNWETLPESDANEKVDRYLRTFFGKMKRYSQNRGG